MVTASSDELVFDENEELCQMIENYLKQEIKRNKVTIEDSKLKQN